MSSSAGDALSRVRCPECGQEIAKKYLPNHRLKKHNVVADGASAAKSDSTS